ncbi:MAG: PQQ-binding-like beta-propeller repeat protein [Planctomycetota bacterium]|jgi:outer membrane protein assembly factor BamB
MKTRPEMLTSSPRSSLLAVCWVAALFAAGGWLGESSSRATAQEPLDPTKQVRESASQLKIGGKDWGQWLGSPFRNNVVVAEKIPLEWDVTTGKNVRWSVKLGSETYGNPVVANGKVYVGTNNGAGYVPRFPNTVDLGALICFDEQSGNFLWQHCNEKLPTGRVHDWPDQGICSVPMIDGDRLWYVSSRGEVVCLDTEGFLDDENDGPFSAEPNQNKDEADVVWKLDMMKELRVSQHNMCSCSVTCAGDLLFVITSNGVDEGHVNLPADASPSFLCMDRRSGKVLWTDSSPGANVLHGQWSSPAYGTLGGVEQAIFGGGDGWLYSFSARGKDGKAELLWKFDCNPKKSRYALRGATRNHVVGTPVIYDGLVYVAVGEDPEHLEGEGHLWCIDPTKRGDTSPTLVFNAADPTKPIPHKRLQACVETEGDFERDNPNSAAVWHYGGEDIEENELAMHRAVGSVAIKNNLLFIADQTGVFHCLDAKTGKPHWAYHMESESWASPLIVNDLVYIGDSDGEIAVFRCSAEMEKLSEVYMESACFTSPIVANDTLFIANRNRLYALQEGAQAKVEEDNGEEPR